MELPTFEFPTVKSQSSSAAHGCFGLTTRVTKGIMNYLSLDSYPTMPRPPELVPILQPENYGYWHTCRESFHGFWEGYDPTGYRVWYYAVDTASYPHSTAALHDICRWMEKKIGSEPVKLALKKNTKIRANQMKAVDIFRVEMTDFWMLNEMRFEFFTAVWKTGLGHKVGENPMPLLLGSKYFMDNPAALHAFLGGANWFDRPKTTTTGRQYPFGWHNTFNVAGKESMLRTPTEEDVRNHAYYLHQKYGGEQWHKAVLDMKPVGS